MPLKDNFKRLLKPHKSYIFFWKPNNSWWWHLSPKKAGHKNSFKSISVLEINFHSLQTKNYFIYRYYLQIELVKTINTPSQLRKKAIRFLNSRAKSGKKTWFCVCSYPCSRLCLQKHLERNFSPFHRCCKRPSPLVKDKRIEQFQTDEILKYFFQPLTF